MDQPCAAAGAWGDGWELIIIDDGSPESTFHLCTEIASTDPRLKILSFARNFGHLAFFYYRLLKVLTEIDIPLDSGDFCVLSRRVLDTMNALPERNRFVRGFRSWVGFRQAGQDFPTSGMPGRQAM